MNCFDEITYDFFNQESKQLVPPGTFGYLFVNKGDSGVTIWQHFLKPLPLLAGPPTRFDLSGESIGYIDPEHYVIAKKSFNIKFSQLPGMPVATNPWVQITFYTKI